jgi:hypothetical protein
MHTQEDLAGSATKRAQISAALPMTSDMFAMNCGRLTPPPLSCAFQVA